MKVLLIGTYSSLNFGDQAMQMAFAEGIIEQSERPIYISISTPNLKSDAGRYQPSYNLIQSSRKSPLLIFLDILNVLANRVAGTHKIAFSPEARAIRDADIVVDLSGDMLTEDYGVLVALTHLHPLLMVRHFKKPLYLVGQSIGPFQFLSAGFKKVLEFARLVSVREPLSHLYVARFAPRSKLVLTADLAFCFHPKVRALEPRQSQARERIGVSFSQLLESKSQSLKFSLVEELAAAILLFTNGKDAEVVLLPHVIGPTRSKDDRIILTKLRGLLGSLPAELVQPSGPAEAREQILSCSLFIGARMHANIAALSSAVPTIAMSYSHKSLGIMSTYGLSAFVLDAKNAKREEILSMLKIMSDEKEDIIRKIIQTNKIVFDKSQENITAVLEDISSWNLIDK